jgi:putative flavoprotein involved in K+ transport
METVSTVVIGGGQAGLATSRLLTDRGVEHVVLERGSVAHRWRERRDTLRLLTPSWMSRLPGWRYTGPDPDGFMTVPQLVDHLEAYARSFAAPVREGTAVEDVRRSDDGFRVRTDRGEIRSRFVVLATGACDTPWVADVAAAADPSVTQLTAEAYRRPGDLPDGGVLVVGASASGAQLAAELRASGRTVVLAVGRHTRLPRTYRGVDIHQWLERLGLLRKPLAPVDGRHDHLHLQSAQLVGSPDRRDVDLPTLQRAGAALTGRLVGLEGARARFADDLSLHAGTADARLRRLLARIDAHIADGPLEAGDVPPGQVPPLQPLATPDELDLRQAGITGIVWATGYRRRYPWLRVPVLGPDGELVHEQGVTAAPGLYAVGLPPLSRRSSTFVDGVGEDARLVVDHLEAAARRRAA